MSSSKQNTLSVPAEGKSKKDRPRSPRRKAPNAPKKKKSPKDKDTESHDHSKESHDHNGESHNFLSTPKGSEKDMHAEKSLTRSISPKYMSVLDEEVGRGDMVLLDPITEDNILENLKKRYTAGEIYVSIKSDT